MASPSPSRWPRRSPGCGLASAMGPRRAVLQSRGAGWPPSGSLALPASPVRCQGLLHLQPAEPRLQGIKQENEIFHFLTERSNQLEVTLFLQFHLLQLGHGGGAGGLPIILIRGAPHTAKLQPRAGSSPGSCWLIMNIFMAAQPGLARLLLPKPCSLHVFWALAGSLQKTSPRSEVWWVLPKG